MAPDACATATRVPHISLHDQDSCTAPPLLPDFRRHNNTHMSINMLRLHARRHLVLLHVRLHVLLPRTATPRASVDTQLAGQLRPRSDHMQRATSSFSVHSPDFGPFGNFLICD
ncbi:hypothetical protein DY000_02005660 [Brassica cretica]|uniref:Uncharacterized protein n=1 Tax=Brassica cretica TaxID=69181 RepID=A0ABQ7CAW3_BRACR|nr:hypothetical protein DY000_02005660 [Brassica cretica]